ncbi:MAG: PQQ-binding-like beta-propeller repeat protein [Verrucomicrobia bacterium]|nr:PQQ-binding-like beta-propeller repeat protein [Verrucomicrobiota bacterium]MDA0724069.1 PQQ-binding-like beta-propeller repeat protein [Verrucomicrobiota bacterium]MDA1045983.1 PQQ-binding-like beta-propeller repeat protein [Verrucomicrobiota bacterium]
MRCLPLVLFCLIPAANAEKANQFGEVAWAFETGSPVRSSPSIGGAGTVFVGSVDKKVYVLNGATGEKKVGVRYRGRSSVVSIDRE